MIKLDPGVRAKLRREAEIPKILESLHNPLLGAR